MVAAASPSPDSASPALAASTVPAASTAQDSATASAEGPTSPPRQLRFNSNVDVPVTAGLALAWVFTEATKKQFAAKHCRWCDANPDGSDNLNSLDASVRRRVKWDNTSRAAST